MDEKAGARAFNGFMVNTLIRRARTNWTCVKMF
jgi:hypothetical protein